MFATFLGSLIFSRFLVGVICVPTLPGQDVGVEIVHSDHLVNLTTITKPFEACGQTPDGATELTSPRSLDVKVRLPLSPAPLPLRSTYTNHPPDKRVVAPLPHRHLHRHLHQPAPLTGPKTRPQRNKQIPCRPFPPCHSHRCITKLQCRSLVRVRGALRG